MFRTEDVVDGDPIFRVGRPLNRTHVPGNVAVALAYMLCRLEYDHQPKEHAPRSTGSSLDEWVVPAMMDADDSFVFYSTREAQLAVVCV